MRKKLMKILAGAIIVCAFVAPAAESMGRESTGLERAYNRCMEGCVELDEAACKLCCEKSLESVSMRCRSLFLECVNACKGDKSCEGNCIYKTRNCGSGATGDHACP